MATNGALNVAETPVFTIDSNYEFLAPQYFDFSQDETAEEATKAERWFETAFSYSASPYAGKSKPICEMSMTCSLEDYIEVQKLVARISSEYEQDKSLVPAASSATLSTHPASSINNVVVVAAAMGPVSNFVSKSNDETHAPVNDCSSMGNIVPSPAMGLVSNSGHQLGEKDCTPRKEQVVEHPVEITDIPIASDSGQPTKKFSQHVLKALPTVTDHTSHEKFRLPRSSRCRPAKRHLAANSNLTLEEHQTNKRRKLEGDGLQQIRNMKSNLESHGVPTLTIPQEFHFSTEERAKVYKETGFCGSAFKVECSKSPFISLAERVRKFQAKTPERFHLRPYHVSTSKDELSHLKNTTLKLTKPKEPELMTSFRARPPRVKSFFEQQEEVLANIPKFKARPINKRILEAPTLQTLPRSTPYMPQFQEFNLRTMERALMHHGGFTYGDESSQKLQYGENLQTMDINRVATKRCISTRGEPHLETAIRARPPKVKSTEEMEREELAKIPKFKARPFNKRIFSSRGDMGIYQSAKRQATRPMEFHFVTDDRAHRHSAPPLNEDNGMTSSCQLQAHEEFVPRLTIPEPFHLATEDRGAFKQSRFQMELLMKEEMERNKKIPKANMLPYTTDAPKIPPKPQPRGITKPVPFHLESLRRHEEEMQRRMEELSKAEKESAAMRAFRAQPILCNAPLFVPERSRKPLTEIQPFVFRAEARAVQRSEFDNKVAEKNIQYQRMKEELEAARREDEERAIKELRKELVFHARPAPESGTPFVPLRSSKELTQPISPNFHASKLKEQRPRHTSIMPLYHMR